MSVYMINGLKDRLTFTAKLNAAHHRQQ